jgi:hypothetical protein
MLELVLVECKQRLEVAQHITHAHTQTARGRTGGSEAHDLGLPLLLHFCCCLSSACLP